MTGSPFAGAIATIESWGKQYLLPVSGFGSLLFSFTHYKRIGHSADFIAQNECGLCLFRLQIIQHNTYFELRFQLIFGSLSNIQEMDEISFRASSVPFRDIRRN